MAAPIGRGDTRRCHLPGTHTRVRALRRSSRCLHAPHAWLGCSTLSSAGQTSRGTDTGASDLLTAGQARGAPNAGRAPSGAAFTPRSHAVPPGEAPGAALGARTVREARGSP